MPATASYQHVRAVKAPCGHVHASDKVGAQRTRDVPVPPVERFDSPCYCGASYTVEVRPITMVVGYEAVIVSGTNVTEPIRGQV